MEEHNIISKLFEQDVNFIRFRYEFKRQMMKLRYKIDIYLVIILGVMIILARAMSLH